jgi:hypothetical protein
MPLTAAILLGTIAQVDGNNLTVIGAGWTVRDPEPGGGAAVGVMVYVPRELEGTEINARLELLYDSSGEPVLVEFPDMDEGERPLVVDGSVEATGRRDIKTPLAAPLAVNLPPFRLPPGEEFRWQLFLNDETRDDWSVRFRTTPPPGGLVDQPEQPQQR